MAKPNTVSEIIEMPNDAVIYCFKGTVVGWYEALRGTIKTGQRKGEKYSFQNLKVKDANGDIIKLVLKDRAKDNKSQDLPDCKGKEITVLATQNKKKQWVGVKALDDKNKKTEKTERVVWATGAAEVIVGVGNASSAKAPPQPKDEPPAPQDDQPGEPSEPEAPRGNTAPPPTTTTTQQQRIVPGTQAAVNNTKFQLARCCNLMLMCIDAALYVAEQFEERTGEAMSAEQYQAVTSSFWIKMSDVKSFDAIPMMPVKPIPHTKAE